MPPGHVYIAESWQEVCSILFDHKAQAAGGAAGGGASAVGDTPAGGGTSVGDGDPAVGRVGIEKQPRGSIAAPVNTTAVSVCREESTAEGFDRVSSPSGGLSASVSKHAAHATACASAGSSGQAAEPKETSGSGAQQCRTRVPRVLVIAGSDSGGGAGIQADIKTCASCGALASTAVTALTAQNSYGVHAVHIPPAEMLRAQIDAIVHDLDGDAAVAVKTGMLPDQAAVDVVAEAVGRLREMKRVHLVVDPVLVSSSGHSLAESDVCRAVLRRLLPLATVVTPNVPEASALLGMLCVLFSSIGNGPPYASIVPQSEPLGVPIPSHVDARTCRCHSAHLILDLCWQPAGSPLGRYGQIFRYSPLGRYGQQHRTSTAWHLARLCTYKEAQSNHASASANVLRSRHSVHLFEEMASE
jgi:hypothetical protein